VDEFGFFHVAQGVLDLRRAVAGDAAGVVGGVVDRPRAISRPSGVRQATTAPRLKSPSTAVTPIGSRLLPDFRASTAPSSRIRLPASCR
jgi:hypothetical protein